MPISLEDLLGDGVGADVDSTDELTEAGGPLPPRGWALPNQIATDPRFNVRLYDPNDPDELERVERLAESMERDGQLDDVILVPVEDGKLVLLSGHRRRRAATLINERRSANNKPLLKLRYQVNHEGGDLFRKAVIANLQRRDFSPMDLVSLIQKVRHTNNWAGFKGAKRVADYLGISVAQVTQHEKFLSPQMDDDLRTRLHQGVISAQSAFDLLSVKPEKREEVMERAADIQIDRNIDQAIRNVETGKASNEGAALDLHSRTRLENPAIKQAIRDTPDATDTPQPMSRKEIVEHLLQFDSSVYGHKNGAVRQWVHALEKAMTGTGGTASLKLARKKFDYMTKDADKGTPDTEPTAERKAHTGKMARHDKGRAKVKSITARAHRAGKASA